MAKPLRPQDVQDYLNEVRAASQNMSLDEAGQDSQNAAFQDTRTFLGTMDSLLFLLKRLGTDLSRLSSKNRYGELQTADSEQKIVVSDERIQQLTPHELTCYLQDVRDQIPEFLLQNEQVKTILQKLENQLAKIS